MACFTFILALISIKVNTNLNIDMIILFPFTVLLFILFQGSYYWYYCLRKVTGKAVNKSWFKILYRTLRFLDIILILLYPLIMIFMFGWYGEGFKANAIFLGIFLYFFGIAEYINYFYVRLSYGKFKDIVDLLKLKNIKKSSLYRELNK